MELKVKQIVFLFLLALLVLLIILTSHSQHAHSDMRFLMNALVTIKVYAKNNQAKAFIEKGFAVFDEIEKISSFYLEQSETAALNRAKRIKASSTMLELLRLSQKAYKQTEGYFDPTFAVLQKAYGFYAPEKKGRIPSDDELIALLKHIGFADKLKISFRDGFVKIASNSLVDFGGIAAGFAVLKAAEALRNAGCKAFLIDDAGDIWFEGTKPDGLPWKIAVKDPRSGESKALALIKSFEAAAVSTSGNYERFVEVNGQRLGHIMDPFTGKPAKHFRSVTVIASNPVDADVFSTALFAMPEKKAIEWANTNNLPMLLLTTDNRIIINNAGKSWFKAVKK